MARGQVVLRLDLRPFERAFRQLAESMAQTAEAAREVGEALAQKLRPDPRLEHGLRNFAADGTWLSDCCAGWVHSACPLPGPCACRCHR